MPSFSVSYVYTYILVHLKGGGDGLPWWWVHGTFFLANNFNPSMDFRYREDDYFVLIKE